MTESGIRNMECSDEVWTAVAFPNVELGSLLHPVPWVSVHGLTSIKTTGTRGIQK